MCCALADGLTTGPTGYSGSATSTKLKVSGIDVFSAGDFVGGGAVTLDAVRAGCKASVSCGSCTDLLCKVATEAEAMDYCAACTPVIAVRVEGDRIFLAIPAELSAAA